MRLALDPGEDQDGLEYGRTNEMGQEDNDARDVNLRKS